jgi:hypothetical protein
MRGPGALLTLPEVRKVVRPGDPALDDDGPIAAMAADPAMIER